MALWQWPCVNHLARSVMDLPRYEKVAAGLHGDLAGQVFVLSRLRWHLPMR